MTLPPGLKAVFANNLNEIQQQYQQNPAYVKQMDEKYGIGLLGTAAAWGHQAIVAWLIQTANVDPMVKANSSFTPLHFAAN